MSISKPETSQHVDDSRFPNGNSEAEIDILTKALPMSDLKLRYMIDFVLTVSQVLSIIDLSI